MIAKSVASGPNKMTYVVVYGLRPYLTDMTVGDLMEGQSYFTLQFNETVNAEVKNRWMCLFDSGQRHAMKSE